MSVKKTTTVRKTVVKKPVAKKAPVKKAATTRKTTTKANKIQYLTTFEQKILNSNLGEKLKKERLEVKVAENSLKNAQQKAVKAEGSFNDARESALVLRENYMKLQNELKMAKIDASESSSEARRREIELIEQTVRTQSAISKRLEEEYQNTIQQIEEVEAKALSARNESEDTYNKISEEVLSDVEISMRSQIEEELDELGERTRVVNLVRDDQQQNASLEDELQYMKLRNQEAIINTDAAREEAEFLQDADEESKEVYAKEQMGLTHHKSEYKIIIISILLAVTLIFSILIILLISGVL